MEDIENVIDDLFNTNQNKPIKDDTDLSGMDTEAAQEYVLSFIASLKQLQKQITDLGLELKGWQERILFARQRNREDLALAAQSKVKELQQKMDTLLAEERDLGFKVKEMMENFKKLKAGFTFSVDAEQLIAELTMAVGEKDTLSAQFKEEETLSELEKLKAKMNAENSAGSGQ